MPTYDNITATLKSYWGLEDEIQELKRELQTTKEELEGFQCPYCKASLLEKKGANRR